MFRRIACAGLIPHRAGFVAQFKMQMTQILAVGVADFADLFAQFYFAARF